MFLRYSNYLVCFLGNDSCELLLSDGHFHGNNVWQPNGCMAHAYVKRYVICIMVCNVFIQHSVFILKLFRYCQNQLFVC